MFAKHFAWYLKKKQKKQQHDVGSYLVDIRTNFQRETSTLRWICFDEMFLVFCLDCRKEKKHIAEQKCPHPPLHKKEACQFFIELFDRSELLLLICLQLNP